MYNFEKTKYGSSIIYRRLMRSHDFFLLKFNAYFILLHKERIFLPGKSRHNLIFPPTSNLFRLSMC